MAKFELREILSDVLDSGKKCLVLPAGKLDIYPADCTQRYCFFSNNDEGVKTIAFDFNDLDDFTLQGNDTELIFHGRISPIVATRCRNLTISGVTIDFADSFVSDATLVKRENGVAYFQIGGKHQLVDGKLVFVGDFYDNFDGKLRFFSFNTARNELNADIRAAVIDNRELLAQGDLVGVPDKFPAEAGKHFIIKHELRFCPGIVFDQCENVGLKNAKLHHAAGMGVLAQCCRNVNIEQVEISPRNRRASVSDDGIHLVECRGKLTIKECSISGMLDDAVNIHGIYRPLKFRIPGGKFYYLDTGHYQQSGLPGAFPGDTLELVKPDTSRPYGKIQLTGAQLVNKAFTRVVFDEKKLPEEYEWGDVARVVECGNAEVEIVNCTFRPCRGRGVLVSGVKLARIADCEIHSTGAAIFVSGDPRFWYESGPVEKLLVENNTFDNCGYSNIESSREAISIFPEIAREVPGFYYHGTIVVRNNRFISAPKPLVEVLSAADVTITGNEWICDLTYHFAPQGDAGYSFTAPDSPAINFRNCGKTAVFDNPGWERIAK